MHKTSNKPLRPKRLGDSAILFSVITATFNAEKYLEHLLNSIAIQKNSDVEFILIDGGSTDKTLEIVKKNAAIVDYWISEHDAGIYDAWNKGIHVARGEWILFLGADDELCPGALEAYRAALPALASGVEVVSSKLDYVDENGRHLKYMGEPWDWRRFVDSRLSLAHPGMLHHWSLLQRTGGFDTSFRISADAELLLRAKIVDSAAFVDFITVKMRRGGVSLSFRALLESFRIRQKNKSMPMLLNICRLGRRILILALSNVIYKLRVRVR